jgi:cytochrome c-type biogenesis protein CcmF
VGPSFFNTFAGPLALFLLFLTGVGPLIAWRRATLANLRRQFVWPVLVGVTTAATLAVLLWDAIEFWPFACWSLSAFVVTTITQEYWRAVSARVRNRGESIPRAFATLLRKNQRRYGGYIVHLGIVFILIGIGGAAFDEERLENVAPGQSVHIQDYRLEYLTADPIPAQHYGGARARLALYRGDEPLAVMIPEKRTYWLEQQPVSIPAIYSTLREDFYVILSAIEPNGSATIKIYRNPLVNCIWLGLGVFIVGSLCIMWPYDRGQAEPASR